MKKLLGSIGVVGLIGIFVWSGVKAADTATVAATVTVQNISVSVAAGTITYGTLGQNSTKSTIPADLNDQQTVTNNGNLTEDFNIRGQNSANWTLAGTAGSDQYIHRFCEGSGSGGGPCESPVTNFTALTTSYQTLATAIAADGTKTLNLHINTPNPSTVFTQQSVDVTVQAVAN
jgi:hypothetical protein